MNNRNAEEKINQCVSELERIKNIIISLGKMSNPVPFLTKYAIIKSCGTIEACFKEIIADYKVHEQNEKIKNFINQKFSIAAIAVIVSIYLLLLRRSPHVYAPDVRSGILVYLAEQFAKAASCLPYYPKIWKPNLLVPVRNLDHFSQVSHLIQAIVTPAGRVTISTLTFFLRKKSAALLFPVPMVLIYQL